MKSAGLLLSALALSMGSAIALGLARFSYALLLPAMRDDLGWSYGTAGAMNTVNAVGYFVGALLTGRALRRWPARTLLAWGSVATGMLLIAHGCFDGEAVLYALRFATGIGSAATFVAGGLLAARLGSVRSDGGASNAGLVIGIFYGGAGIGIVVSALLVPFVVADHGPHAWQPGWIALGVSTLVASALMVVGTRGIDATAAATATRPTPYRAFGFGLAAYFLFGVGYIGYMTFVISLLREQHLAAAAATAFYLVLGVACCASSWLWARLLQRCRGGEAMTLLVALLAVATLLPVLTAHPVAVFVSGILFGSAFLSVVASTTALVRHNLDPTDWPAGIASFTTMFAAGQIVGPVLVGAVSDATDGLRSGFVLSAAVLALAAAIAWCQKPLRGA